MQKFIKGINKMETYTLNYSDDNSKIIDAAVSILNQRWYRNISN